MPPKTEGRYSTESLELEGNTGNCELEMDLVRNVQYLSSRGKNAALEASSA